MKNKKNTKTVIDLSCLKKSFEIEVKIYNGVATSQDIDYVESFITKEHPSPRLEYLLGLAYYLGIGRDYNPTKGETLFRDVFNRGNEIIQREQELTIMAVTEGRKVVKKNYLTIYPTPVKAKTWTSPLNGKSYEIPEHNSVCVRVGEGFKARVAEKSMPRKLCRTAVEKQTPVEA